MNTIIGQAASENKFYLRKGLINRLWKKILNRSNNLMSAPRRIKKTSIMLHLLIEHKPIYYALMHFMQDQYPDELKKMGAELEDTVHSIL